MSAIGVQPISDHRHHQPSQDLDYTCLRPFSGILSGARIVVAEDEIAANQGKLRNIVTKQENLLGVRSTMAHLLT